MARIKNNAKRSPHLTRNSPQKNKELGQASSSKNTSLPKSEVRSESSSDEISKNQQMVIQQTTKPKKRDSKRKSYIPIRRKSVTEEYTTNHKRYAIQRFGHVEQCSRKQYFELKHFQRSTHLLIPRLPFSRLIREILLQHLNTLRIQVPALLALQEAAEIYLVDMFGLCNLLAAHAKRKTVTQKDMALMTLLKNTTSGSLYHTI